MVKSDKQIIDEAVDKILKYESEMSCSLGRGLLESIISTVITEYKIQLLLDHDRK